MKTLITGATGLVGTALIQILIAEGHEVYRLKRPGGEGNEAVSGVSDATLDPRSGLVSTTNGGSAATPLHVSAVVNLAGAPIAKGRWTPERKSLLRSSRVDTTRDLVEAIGKMQPRPEVLISASAVGYYGNRGDEVLTEKSEAGGGFLAEVAKDWEAQARKGEDLGIRVVLARFGIILSKQGGALPEIMAPFKVGAGGRLGSGRQWMPWIGLDDAIRMIHRALEDASFAGVINVVSPEPVRNAEFTRVLAEAMHRPALFAAPAFALRLAVGAEKAEALFLASQRVVPGKLEELGFTFVHGNLTSELAAAV